MNYPTWQAWTQSMLRCTYRFWCFAHPQLEYNLFYFVIAVYLYPFRNQTKLNSVRVTSLRIDCMYMQFRNQWREFQNNETWYLHVASIFGHFSKHNPGLRSKLTWHKHGTIFVSGKCVQRVQLDFPQVSLPLLSYFFWYYHILLIHLNWGFFEAAGFPNVQAWNLCFSQMTLPSIIHSPKLVSQIIQCYFDSLWIVVLRGSERLTQRNCLLSVANERYCALWLWLPGVIKFSITICIRWS